MAYIYKEDEPNKYRNNYINASLAQKYVLFIDYRKPIKNKVK